MRELLLLIGILVFTQYSISQNVETFTDSRDKKEYKYVKIGKQVWMAENLNYETPEGSWCYNDANECEKNGRFYNWETAISVCPDGWKLPTLDEWTVLMNYLLENSIKIKDKSLMFNLINTGMCYDGTVREKGKGAYWWASSDIDEENAWQIMIYSVFMEDLTNIKAVKEIKMPVRCIKK